MRILTPCRLVAITFVMALGSNALGQSLRWNIVHDEQVGNTRYEITALATYGESFVAATSEDDTTIHKGKRVWSRFLRSDDAGLTWRALDPKLPVGTKSTRLWDVQMIDSLHIVAVGDSGWFLSSSDGGVGWRDTILTPRQLRRVHFSDPNVGIINAMGSPNSFVTYDGGRSWHALDVFSMQLWASRSESLGGRRFRALTYAAGPILYTDDGWQTMDSSRVLYPFSDTTHIIYDFQSKGLDTLVAFGVNWKQLPLDKTFLIMSRSLDGGATWESIPIVDSLLVKPHSMSDLDRPYVLLSGYGNGSSLYAVSHDHGINWQFDSVVSPHIPNRNTITHAAVTRSGVAVAVLSFQANAASGYVIRGVPQDRVDRFEYLVANTSIFPNPASTVVHVHSIARSQPVSVYDVLGRECLRGTLDQNGDARFDVSSLPRGIYSVLLRQGVSIVSVGRVSILP